jgi:hypothetical protein
MQQPITDGLLCSYSLRLPSRELGAEYACCCSCLLHACLSRSLDAAAPIYAARVWDIHACPYPAAVAWLPPVSCTLREAHPRVQLLLACTVLSHVARVPLCHTCVAINELIVTNVCCCHAPAAGMCSLVACVLLSLLATACEEVELLCDTHFAFVISH